jgi:hypothetical protein
LTTSLDAFLHRWEGFCAAQCARLIWRETTPQHFDTPGGVYRGNSFFKKSCVPLRPAELDIATARNDAAAEALEKHPSVLRVRTSTGYGVSFAFIIPSRSWSDPIPSEPFPVVRESLRRLTITLGCLAQLPVWHMLAQRPDAHDKPIRYKEKALKYDCTHWSMPGVVDETVHLLYSLLLAHSTVVPNPNPSIAGVV